MQNAPTVQPLGAFFFVRPAIGQPVGSGKLSFPSYHASISRARRCRASRSARHVRSGYWVCFRPHMDHIRVDHIRALSTPDLFRL